MLVFCFIGGRIQSDLAKQTVTFEAVPHSDDGCSEKQECARLKPNSRNRSQPCPQAFGSVFDDALMLEPYAITPDVVLGGWVAPDELLGPLLAVSSTRGGVC